MTVNATNINLGACDVTFNGNDLGATKGGVEVEIKTETYEVKVDQLGDAPCKAIITGTTVMVTVPMAESDLVKLAYVMPQSTAIPSTAAAPTGLDINNVGGYAVGVTSVLMNGGAGVADVGQTFVFAGHTTVYRVLTTDGTTTMTFCQHATGSGGLVAPVIDTEEMTFTAATGGLEIRTGVNTDLLAASHALLLHPTGVSGAIVEDDFTAFKACPVPDFKFKYELNGEKIFEVKFQCYPDTSSNNKICCFGATA